MEGRCAFKDVGECGIEGLADVSDRGLAGVVIVTAAHCKGGRREGTARRVGEYELGERRYGEGGRLSGGASRDFSRYGGLVETEYTDCGLEGGLGVERALAHRCAEVECGSYIARVAVREEAALVDLDCEGMQVHREVIQVRKFGTSEGRKAAQMMGVRSVR